MALKALCHGTEWALQGKGSVPDAFIAARGSGLGRPLLLVLWPGLDPEDPGINQVQACLKELAAKGSDNWV